MPERLIGVTDEASGAGVADYRTREQSAKADQYLVLEEERVPSFKGMAATFRVPGVTGSGQHFMSIFNAAGSVVLVAVRRLTVQTDVTTNSGTVRFFTASRLTAAPTGGTALEKVPFDSALTSSASVTLLSGASADGVASAITATVGVNAWRQGQTRFASTDLQQSRVRDELILARLAAGDPVILRAGEGLLVTLTDASSTSAHVIGNCMFEEFTLP
ncbi:MAG: hypothetical protein LC798_12725 [Chloroflexi bacterium]|nr:hypothetical protein [Chloroflexota bacterium]